MSTTIPERLKSSYEQLQELTEVMTIMKRNQSLRGFENLQARMAHRAATHTSWRQMKGIQFALHEINHPGTRPFVIGLGITSTIMTYLYVQALKSDEIKAKSVYWQRYHAADEEKEKMKKSSQQDHH